MTLGEFVNYYTNLGAHIDNDDYFERVVRALWHVDAAVSSSTDPRRSLAPSTSASYKPSSSHHPPSSGGASLIDPALISAVAGVKSKPDDSYWSASWGSGRPGNGEWNTGKKHSAHAMTLPEADLGVQLVLGKVRQELQRRGDRHHHTFLYILVPHLVSSLAPPLISSPFHPLSPSLSHPPLSLSKLLSPLFSSFI